MRSLAVAVLLLALLTDGRTGLAQDKGDAIIQGSVYDLHQAAIVDVWISIENTRTAETRSLQTDDGGRYSASVQEGRYRVSMRPKPGHPFGYEHASFQISSGERVIVNFRPEPFAISSSIEGGHWLERYEGDFPTYTTHFVQQPGGAIKDLRIQCGRLRTRGNTFEYRFWVIASFDRLTVYTDRVVFEAKKARLVAEGDVLFEDGKRVRKATRVEIDLLTGAATVSEVPIRR